MPRPTSLASASNVARWPLTASYSNRDSGALSSSWIGAEMPATQRNQISMIVYTPALAGDDGRTLAVVRGMERTRAGLRIGLMISDEGQLIPLPERDAFVARESSRGEMPPLRSTDDNFPSERNGMRSTGGPLPWWSGSV
jgi:hypothetical protein